MSETRELALAAQRAAAETRIELERERSARQTPQARLWVLLATLIGCLVVLGVSSFLVPPAFTTPSANLTDFGAVNVYVFGLELNQTQRSLLEQERITLTTSVQQGEAGVRYQLDFPPELAGRPFALGIVGSAVLTNVRSDDSTFTNEYPACTSRSNAANCQLITGRVPVPTDTHVIATSLCLSGQKEHEVVSVTFTGDAHLNSSPDWAHHLTSLPYLGSQPDTAAADDIVGGSLGSDYEHVRVAGCQYLTRNPQWTDTTSSWPPSFDKGDLMMWKPNDDGAMVSVVSAERSAAWKGNMLLALIGIAGGGALTLLVATYRARPRRRTGG